MQQRNIDPESILLEELKQIEAWERDQNDLWFWEKLARVPFLLIDKIIPKKMHHFMAKRLDEVGNYIQYGGRYLVSREYTLKEIGKKGKLKDPTSLQLSDVGHLPIQVLNEMAEELILTRKHLATVQGATTGFGGIITLAIDIPALLSLSLKVLQEMCITYGYDPTDEKERIFIIKCLQFSAADIIGKKAILKELSQYHDNPDKDMISQINGWKEVIDTFRGNYGIKKLLQIVPIIGVFFGAYTNRTMIEDVATTGHMLYRKRRVLEKQARLKDDTNQISHRDRNRTVND